MQFGICASPDQAPALKQAGFDYVEVNVQHVFRGQAESADDAMQTVQGAELPAPAANCLVPGDLKIVGPHADLQALATYMERVTDRAGRCGTTTLVFGSGAARNVPEGTDRDSARSQILAFLEQSAPLAQQHGVTLVIEPLNRGECNILNSVGEAMEYVRELNHPAVQCLVDSYHFWLENEPLRNLEEAIPHIRHVHVADKVGRVAPGVSGQSDYREFFRVLKRGGYDRLISIEGSVALDDADALRRHHAYLQDGWASA